MGAAIKIALLALSCYAGYRITDVEPKTVPAIGLQIMLSLLGIFFLDSISAVDGVSVKHFVFMCFVMILYSKAYNYPSSDKQKPNYLTTLALWSLNAAGIYAILRFLAETAKLF